MKLLILAIMLMGCDANLQCVDGVMYDCGLRKGNDCILMNKWGTNNLVKCIKRVK